MESDNTRRRFLTRAVCGGAGVAWFPEVVRAKVAAEAVLRIGVVADAQYADVDAVGSRFYREGAPRLAAAVEEFNGLELDFCVHLGDLIDRSWGSFDEMEAVLKRSRHRFYHVLGNHDFSVLDGRKAEVPGRIGLGKRYYAVGVKGFRFVFLDTTDVSTYAHPAGSEETVAAKGELAKWVAAKVPQAQEWNGAIGEGQMRWFVRECEGAAKVFEKVVVFSHHPVVPAGGHTIWNAEEVLGKTAGYSHIVGWYSGHNHAGGYGESGGVPFVTLEGMVETRDTTAYAVAEVYGDRVVLAGRGRATAREMVFGG